MQQRSIQNEVHLERSNAREFAFSPEGCTKSYLEEGAKENLVRLQGQNEIDSLLRKVQDE